MKVIDKRTIKLIFYKYGFQIICIILEIIGMVAFFSILAHYSTIITILAYVFNFVAFISIINDKKRPDFKIPWISVILLFPPFGTLLYALFYNRRISKKEISHFRNLEKEYESFIKNKNYSKNNMSLNTQGIINNLLYDDYLAHVYTGTDSKYYSLGDTMYVDMLRDLKKAKKFIFLEYFIVADGEMWESILHILEDKVKNGVEVRMLYDDIGCMTTLPSDYDKLLRDRGIKCYKFNKVTPQASSIHNNRDHRKILVIDGEIGYTGGINLADEYINKIEKYGHWKDGGIRLDGDAVNNLTILFLLNYDINNLGISDYKKYLGNHKMKSEGLYIPFGDGPEPLYQYPVGENLFLNMINQATRYVYITTPYLIIDYTLCDALKKAAIRGVDVRIVTPHIPDKKIIHLITRSFYNELIGAGVKIYEYEKGFIHSKLVLTDDIYGFVGTINFDYRSFVHHFEDGVFMYQTGILKDIKKDIIETIKVSKKMGMIKLSFAHRTLLSLLRLFITMF